MQSPAAFSLTGFPRRFEDWKNMRLSQFLPCVSRNACSQSGVGFYVYAVQRCSGPAVPHSLSALATVSLSAQSVHSGRTNSSSRTDGVAPVSLTSKEIEYMYRQHADSFLRDLTHFMLLCGLLSGGFLARDAQAQDQHHRPTTFEQSVIYTN
jgi:hypothetical protein